MDWPITKRIAPTCRARQDLSSGIKMFKPEVVRFRTFVPGPLEMCLLDEMRVFLPRDAMHVQY